MAYNTGNPVGSSDFRDLSDNAVNFDKYSVGPDPAYPNRLGVLKLSIEGMNQEFNNAQDGRQALFETQIGAMGYTWLADYGPGLNFTSRNQYTVRDGLAYSVANSTTLPYTTTGNWATEVSKFKAINIDDILRQELADPSQGGDLVGHNIGATGQAQRTVKSKLREVQVNANDFFLAGMTDYALAINAAIAYVATLGGGVVNLPSGHFNTSTTVVNRNSGVLIRGAGAGNEHDVVGAIDAATALLWTGPAGGTMVDIAPTPGASNRRISGTGIVGLGLYGQGVAGFGLSAKSLMFSEIDIYAESFTTGAVDLNVVATLGEAKDFRDSRIRINAKQTANTDGFALRIGGDTSANVCYNSIYLRSLYKNSTAFICGNSDNNTIEQWTFRFGGGTGKGTECLGGSVDLLTSRANLWSRLYAGDGGFYVYGTADGYAVASTRNRCLDWDNDNTQPLPTIGAGASFSKLDKDQQLTWTEIGLQRSAPNRMDFYGGGGARLVRFQFSIGATGALTMAHGAGTVSLAAVSDTLPDVSFGLSTKGAGAGDLYSGNFAAKKFSWSSAGISFYGADVVAKPVVTGAKGGNAALTSLLAALNSLGLVTDSST